MRTVVVVTLVTAVLSGDALTRLAAQVVAPGTRADEQATLTAQQHAQARMQGDVAALRTVSAAVPVLAATSLRSPTAPSSSAAPWMDA